MTLSEEEQRLDRLVASVLASAKYGRIDPEFVRAVGARELSRRRDEREAAKATRSKLHQVVAAYRGGRFEADRWLAELARAYDSGDDERIRTACREVMRFHASTRERLPILDDFYATIFERLPPVRSVLDLACGLNPLALPWMPLAAGAVYRACDIDGGLVDFLNRFFALAPIDGRAEVRDVVPEPAWARRPAGDDAMFDLALILKAIPCLEQIDREAGAHLLGAIRARHLVVSFPGRSLGGRGKGMATTYSAHFHDLIASWDVEVERVDLPGEIVFVVRPH